MPGTIRRSASGSAQGRPRREETEPGRGRSREPASCRGKRCGKKRSPGLPPFPGLDFPRAQLSRRPALPATFRATPCKRRAFRPGPGESLAPDTKKAAFFDATFTSPDCGRSTTLRPTARNKNVRQRAPGENSLKSPGIAASQLKSFEKRMGRGGRRKTFS